MGRRRDLTEIRRRLASATRLVTLTGPGGMGKSRLALAAAAEHSRATRHPLWCIEISELAEPVDGRLLLLAVAEAMGLQLPQAQVTPEGLAAATADRAGLLVLDGCERALDEVAALVAVLLAGCRNLRVLTTGHRPLGITGELVVQLGPLAHPEPGTVRTAEEAMRYDAVELFVDRASAVLPSFRFGDDNAAAVADLCAALEGVPLALELAAARVTVLSPQGILERLGDRYRVLSKAGREAPGRHRSLRASVDTSFELCSLEERLLWARLSVFVGGFDLAAAEAVCAGEGVDELEVLDLVDGLLEKSVLAREDSDPSVVRYRMLQSLRTYGDERLDPEQRDVLRRRHLEWCRVLVQRAADEWFGPDQAAWCHRLRAEQANIREALDYAFAHEELVPAGLRMVIGLEQYWVVSGRLGEARHWLSLAVGAEVVEDRDRAAAAFVASWMAATQLDLRAAKDLLDAGRAAVQRLDNEWGRGLLLLAEAVQDSFAGRTAEAVDHARSAAVLFGTAGDSQHEAAALFVLGMAFGFSGETDVALAAHQRCLDLTEPVGELHMRSYTLVALALLAFAQGDQDTAEIRARDALRLKLELRDRFATTFVLEVLAWVAAVNDAERAATLLGIADTRWQELGLSAETIPFFSAQRATAEEQAGASLRQRTFESLRRRGAALPEDLAIAFALEEQAEGAATVDPALEVLTQREVEVVQLVARGLTNRDIAAELVISERTAAGHVENILRKLGLSSRTQVAAWVAKREAERRRERPHLFAVGDER